MTAVPASLPRTVLRTAGGPRSGSPVGGWPVRGPRRGGSSGVLKGTTIVRVSVGAEHACALDDEGRAYCWGSNDRGQLGTTQDEGPRWSTSRSPVRASAGGSRSARPPTSSPRWCGPCRLGRQLTRSMSNGRPPWARRLSGGQTRTRRSSHSQVRGRRGPHLCHRRGSVGYCWGANDRGQLGNGTTQPSLVPVPVAPPPGAAGYGYTSISVGAATSCGWGGDGSVTCWGQGGAGQLTDDADARRSQGRVSDDLDAGPMHPQRRGELRVRRWRRWAGVLLGCELGRPAGRRLAR